MRTTLIQTRTATETTTAVLSATGAPIWACVEPGTEGARGILAAVSWCRERGHTVEVPRARRSRRAA